MERGRGREGEGEGGREGERVGGGEGKQEGEVEGAGVGERASTLTWRGRGVGGGRGWGARGKAWDARRRIYIDI
jgi:hypothetical protein